MKQSLGIALLGCTLCMAQSPTATGPGEILTQTSRMQRIILEQGMRDDGTAERLHAEQRAALQRQQEFLDKAARFVDLWQKFALELNDHKVNYKLAKQLTQAFHDLERCDGWPTKGSK